MKKNRENHEKKEHKLLIAVISLFLAVCMWMYVAPDGESEFRNLTVTYLNEASLSDYSLMLDMDEIPTVTITVYGRRSDLLNLDQEDIEVTVDLSRIQEAGEYELEYTVTLPDSSSTTELAVSEYTTESVTVTVVEQVSRTIEVKGIWNGEVAEGNYLAEQLVMEPSEITISGPQELVDSVSYAQVVLERTNLSESVTEELEYTLVDYNGEPVYSEKITCDVETITTTQPIVLTKELQLTVTYIAGGGATEDDVTTTIEPSSITISGDQTTLDGINSISLGTIDLGEVTGTMEYTFSVLIPNDAKNLSEVTEATVTVTVKGLETADFRIPQTSFEMINVPEEFDISFVTQYLQVTVRGTPETVALLQSNNIRVVADLTSVNSVGQQAVPVTVYIDGYTDVGALGEYTVYVTVTEHVEEEEIEEEEEEEEEAEEEDASSDEETADDDETEDT